MLANRRASPGAGCAAAAVGGAAAGVLHHTGCHYWDVALHGGFLIHDFGYLRLLYDFSYSRLLGFPAHLFPYVIHCWMHWGLDTCRIRLSAIDLGLVLGAATMRLA